MRLSLRNGDILSGREIFSDFLLHLTATSSNDETIRVTTNVDSRLGDLVVVMELPWKRRDVESRPALSSIFTVHVRDKSRGGWNNARQVETEEPRQNISTSCGSLIENSSRNLALVRSPFLSSSRLFSSTYVHGCVSPSPPYSTSDPLAVPRAVVSFLVNSIFAARDFSVGFLGCRSRSRDGNPPTIAGI